jgi:hypothetical protein
MSADLSAFGAHRTPRAAEPRWFGREADEAPLSGVAGSGAKRTTLPAICQGLGRFAGAVQEDLRQRT